MSQVETATAIPGTIQNPNNPQHCMAIKPVERRVRVFAGETLLADTTDAVRVIEIGRSVYDPVLYVPEADVAAPLERLDKSTHCPLKGDASYFALGGEEIAWSYETPFEFAEALAGRRGFWASKVRIEEGG